MEFIDGATHNEIAVIACLVAMVGSMGLMLLSGAAFGNSGTQHRVTRKPDRVRGEMSRRVGPRNAEQDAA